MKITNSEKKISYFSEELETLEKKIGELLNTIESSYSDEAFLFSQSSILELRANFLYQRADRLKQEISSFLQQIQDPAPDRMQDEVSPALLRQQMILAEGQRLNLKRLLDSLTEMKKAAGTKGGIDHLLLLRQLKTCLESFGNQPHGS